MKLYKELSSQNNNLIVLPFLVSNAFVIVHYGARDKTVDEISRVIFGKEFSVDQLQLMTEKFNDLVNKNIKANPEVLNVANFMYSKIELNILDEYKDGIVKYFYAEANELDFKKYGAISKINNDVYEATKGKAKDLI